MTTEYNRFKTWKQEHSKGIRTKCLINLMYLESRLKEDYSKLDKPEIGYIGYINEFNRIKDAAKILNCSERTARDYRDALVYFSMLLFHD
ncbi:NUMOD1 domain-containing DNA-binding protein [uncultured Methanobacterium sp.]|uniref:NUMOD1 domain-containing DNA-binding protein n=1 Tax=uncultured Methanobacterium sp. TaxID=176306 RepID=UPI002803B326|nr:NUMOD1 domain-containing DNA-binding protein [uncultured Methanobacterium sp.]